MSTQTQFCLCLSSLTLLNAQFGSLSHLPRLFLLLPFLIHHLFAYISFRCRRCRFVCVALFSLARCARYFVVVNFCINKNSLRTRTEKTKQTICSTKSNNNNNNQQAATARSQVRSAVESISQFLCEWARASAFCAGVCVSKPQSRNRNQLITCNKSSAQLTFNSKHTPNQSHPPLMQSSSSLPLQSTSLS